MRSTIPRSCRSFWYVGFAIDRRRWRAFVDIVRRQDEARRQVHEVVARLAIGNPRETDVDRIELDVRKIGVVCRRSTSFEGRQPRVVAQQRPRCTMSFSDSICSNEYRSIRVVLALEDL